MANFKGGFAFNNAAAKVEVEQAPDGTLISCVNPVTGEELGGGGGGDFTTATVTIRNINASHNCSVSMPLATDMGCQVGTTVNKSTEVTKLVPLYNGAAYFHVSGGFVVDDFTGEYEGYTGEEGGTIKGDCTIDVEYD